MTQKIKTEKKLCHHCGRFEPCNCKEPTPAKVCKNPYHGVDKSGHTCNSCGEGFTSTAKVDQEVDTLQGDWEKEFDKLLNEICSPREYYLCVKAFIRNLLLQEKARTNKEYEEAYKNGKARGFVEASGRYGLKKIKGNN